MNDNLSVYGKCWGFPLEFGSGKSPKINMVSGIEAVRQSLRILFLTEPGERIMREAYGAGMIEFLFQNITDDLLVRMEAVIYDSVLRYEPRANIESVTIRPDILQTSRLVIQIKFGLQGSDIISSLKATVDAHEGSTLRFI